MGYLVYTLVAFLIYQRFIPALTSSELDTPSNLVLNELKEKNAHISWEAVSKEALLECYARYLVKIWSEDGNDTFLINTEITSTDIPYYPGVVNNISVSLSTCNAVGSPSNVVTFKAPEEEPARPEFFNLHQLGNDSILVTWYQPRTRSGRLLGYRLFYGDLSKAFSIENSNHYEITDIDKEQAKLWDLTPDATYRVGIYSVNSAGESKANYNEIRLRKHTPSKPSKPTFTWKVNHTVPDLDEFEVYSRSASKFVGNALSTLEQFLKPSKSSPTPPSEVLTHHTAKKGNNTNVESHPDRHRSRKTKREEDNEDDCITNLVIIWHPNLNGNPGHYFSVKMREKGTKEFVNEYTQYSEDFVVSTEYNACKAHEVVVTSIDGEFETDSSLKEIPAIPFDKKEK